MIKIFTLNVGEEILNKFKDLEIHSYYDNFCTPTAMVYKNNKFIKLINDANYARINSCILELK